MRFLVVAAALLFQATGLFASALEGVSVSKLKDMAESISVPEAVPVSVESPAAAGPEEGLPAVRVSEDIQEAAKVIIKKTLLDNKARVLALDRRISITFDKHFNPRNPLVGMQSPIYRRAFFLHEAKEVRYEVAPAARKAALYWDTSAHPDKMDIGKQVEAVIGAAEFLTARLAEKK